MMPEEPCDGKSPPRSSGDRPWEKSVSAKQRRAVITQSICHRQEMHSSRDGDRDGDPQRNQCRYELLRELFAE